MVIPIGLNLNCTATGSLLGQLQGQIISAVGVRLRCLERTQELGRISEKSTGGGGDDDNDDDEEDDDDNYDGDDDYDYYYVDGFYHCVYFRDHHSHRDSH